MTLLRCQDYRDGPFTSAFLGYRDESDHTVIELTYNLGVERCPTGTGYGYVTAIS